MTNNIFTVFGELFSYSKNLTFNLPYNDTDFMMFNALESTQEKDWKRTRFVSGGDTSPSEATRRKLRAKRKSRK